ncbi:hypothetical protein BN1723_019868, partial [Verticillium longisporum]
HDRCRRRRSPAAALARRCHLRRRGNGAPHDHPLILDAHVRRPARRHALRRLQPWTRLDCRRLE